MSIENTHLPKVPDFPPQDPTAYELLGGNPEDTQTGIDNQPIQSSVTPTAEQTRVIVMPDHKKSFSEKHLNTRFRKWGAGMLVAASALSLGGVGYSIAQSKSVEVQHTNDQEKPFDPLAIPYNLMDSKQYTDLDTDHQMEIDKLNALSAEEFAALPLETQFKFNSLQLDRYEPWALKVAKHGNILKKELPIDNPPTVSLQSSGQDIVNDAAIKRCVQWYSLTKQSQGGSGALAETSNVDRTTAVKMESLRTSVGTLIYNHDQKQLTSEATFENSTVCSADVLVDKESPIITINGEKAKVVHGLNEESGKTVQQVYIYSELTDYKGEKRQNWILSDTGIDTTSKVWYPDPSTLK